jgi:hypothetical protein
MKYNIGDIVLLNNNWDNRYALILDIHYSKDDESKLWPSYRLMIQTTEYIGWISGCSLVRKVP